MNPYSKLVEQKADEGNRSAAILAAGRAGRPRSSSGEDSTARLLCVLCLLVTSSSVRGAATHRTTTDSVGGESVSASYSLRTSLGAYGGIASGANPGVTARHGYLGQFFDVTGIALSAASTNISEEGTQQLIATARLDDGTTLIANSQMAWKVLSGPIADVSSSGVVTAGPVPQATPSVVAAQFQGLQTTLGLTVLDIDPDNFGFYADDGLPDSWQAQFFGTNNLEALPAADTDRDGQNNLLEYLYGTVPNDPDSKFQLNIRVDTNQPGQCVITFWPRFNDREYVVEARPELRSGSFSPLGGASTNDAGQVRTVTDAATTLSEQRFYRIRISKP